MPSVNFDEQYPINRKVDGLSDAAFRLHTSAIFWCFRNTTDGFIPAEDLELVCPRVRSAEKLAAECVRRKVWHEAGAPCSSKHCPEVEADGWVIHDYLQYQPSKDEARAERDGKSDGGSLGNHRRWHAGRGITKSGCPFCLAVAPASDNRSGTESHPPTSEQVGSDSYARGSISIPISTNDPSVVSHLPDRSARAIDDDLLNTIIRALEARTGRTVTADVARDVATDILRASKTPVGSRRAYVQQAIRNEPDPKGRWLPTEREPPPSACGNCGPYRRLEDAEGNDLGACPVCVPGERSAAS